MKIILLFAAFGASLIFAACSGQKGSDTGVQTAAGKASVAKAVTGTVTAISDPCKLLTVEEASAEMGVTVHIGRVQNAMAKTCQYIPPSNDWLDALTVSVEDADFYDGLAGTPGSVPISGIGEKAVWLHLGASDHLDILKDGNLVEVIFPSKSPARTAAMTQVGKEIAGRM